MSLLKKLAGQTALYGVSSMLGRFLNYLLVPLHTAQFEPGVYGVITELYAYVAFLVAILTYGMETAFFRYSLHRDKETVYSNALGSLLASSTLFLVMALLFASPVAGLMGYEAHPEYITWFAIILALDAISAIPLARLREENKAFRFAFINLFSMLVNIGGNMFFIWYCMARYRQGETNWLTDTFYSPAIGVGYVFISNLLSSAVKCLLLLPEFLKLRLRFDWKLLKEMLLYALPLLFAGLGGIINETFSRGFFKFFLEDKIGYDAAMYELGVFGAVYKLSILITLFIQAYRYAAEPFFFKQSKEDTGKAFYAQMMNYFVFIVFGMFLVVSLFIDEFKIIFLKDEKYWEGLPVVPILLVANAFLGISYNLSVWYKLSGKTIYGAYIAGLGAWVTVMFNWLLIPSFGYTGAAWATFACYTSIMLMSYLWGQKFYPIPYHLRKNAGIFVLALILFFIDSYLDLTGVFSYILKCLFLFIFAAIFILIEKPAFIFNRK